MNIFDLPGPEFLALFVLLIAVTVPVAWLLPHLLRGPADLPMHARGGDNSTDTFDPYEVAYLRGGPAATVRTTLVALHERGLAKPDPTLHAFKRTERPSAALSPMEAAVYNRLQAQPVNVSQLDKVPVPETLTQKLAAESLIVPPGRRALFRWMRFLAYSALLAIGITKIFVGLSRDRPIIALLFLCGFVFLLMGIATFNVPRTTWRGKRLLAALKRRHSALAFASRRADTHNGLPLDTLAMALFGVAGLGMTSELTQTFLSPPSISDGGGGGCGSGGDGADGGGGGGCGGCGGGGD